MLGGNDDARFARGASRTYRIARSVFGQLEFQPDRGCVCILGRFGFLRLFGGFRFFRGLLWFFRRLLRFFCGLRRVGGRFRDSGCERLCGGSHGLFGLCVAGRERARGEKHGGEKCREDAESVHGVYLRFGCFHYIRFRGESQQLFGKREQPKKLCRFFVFPLAKTRQV